MVTTKERLDGTYRLSAYWLAKMTAELPLTFVIVWISWTIMFLMTGMTLDIRLYIGSLFVVFAGALLSEVRFLNRQLLERSLGTGTPELCENSYITFLFCR